MDTTETEAATEAEASTSASAATSEMEREKYTISLDNMHSSKQSLQDLKLLNFRISYCLIVFAGEVTFTFYFYFYFLCAVLFTFYSSNCFGSYFYFVTE